MTPLELSFYYYYSLLHIPITIAIDSSVVIPPKYHPATSLIQWHIKQNNDFLLYEKPTWLFYFVWIELFFQLPLFVYFVLAIPQFASKKSATTHKDNSRSKQKQETLYKWLKIYGYNASITTLMCIYVIFSRGYYPSPELDFSPLSTRDTWHLVAVYLPTLLIPLRLCFI